MSDHTKTVHIQIQNSAERDGDACKKSHSEDSLVRALRGFAKYLDKCEAENAKKKENDDERPAHEGPDSDAACDAGEADSEDSLFRLDEDEEFSISDLLHAIHFLSDVLEVPDDEDTEACEEKSSEEDEEEKLTRDQKRVLIGYDVACDSLLMFFANLDLYRASIRKALLAYVNAAGDDNDKKDIIEEMFSSDALCALATGEADGDDEEEYGPAFAVYKVLRDAMMDSLKNCRKHIVTSFVQNNAGENVEDDFTAKEEKEDHGKENE